MLYLDMGVTPSTIMRMSPSTILIATVSFAALEAFAVSASAVLSGMMRTLRAAHSIAPPFIQHDDMARKWLHVFSPRTVVVRVQT